MGLINLRAFESEKLILIASAKYNVSWQNPKPSGEGPSRFELSSGFQRWQIGCANSHRHLVLPFAGKAKELKRHLVQIMNAKSTNENSTINTDWNGILLTYCRAPLKHNRNGPLTILRFMKTKRCYCTRQCLKCQRPGTTNENWIELMLYTNLVCYQRNTVKCQSRAIAQATAYILTGNACIYSSSQSFWLGKPGDVNHMFIWYNFTVCVLKEKGTK